MSLDCCRNESRGEESKFNLTADQGRNRQSKNGTLARLDSNFESRKTPSATLLSAGHGRATTGTKPRSTNNYMKGTKASTLKATTSVACFKQRASVLIGLSKLEAKL
jgi:hypothetical protein